MGTKKDCGCRDGNCGDQGREHVEALPPRCAPNPGEGDSCRSGVNRRVFLKAAGAGVAGVSILSTSTGAMAGPFDSSDHFIPGDKKLNADWVKALFARGEPVWYSGEALETIGMPVGGICTGQMYLAGDGRLACWDVYNRNVSSGWGQVNYKPGRKVNDAVVNGRTIQPYLVPDQGFAVMTKAGDVKQARVLDQDGFPKTRFRGEYPMGIVDYSADGFPVAVRLEAFSPFLPLNSADSALPATVLAYTVTNESDEALEATVTGWLENASCLYNRGEYATLAEHVNRVGRGDGFAWLEGGSRLTPRAEAARPPEVFADFEGGNYGDWTLEGEAFGEKPAGGTLESQQRVTGFKGKGLVNTYLGGNDAKTGKATSPEFTIERHYIGLLVGGGAHEGTRIELIVDGTAVRSAKGKNHERLTVRNWDVKEYRGKQARIVIVDEVTGGWGHINVDQIEFRDGPMGADAEAFKTLVDQGTVALSVLDERAPIVWAGVEGEGLDRLFPEMGGKGTDREVVAPFGKPPVGALGSTVKLLPGEAKTVTFVVSWCLPNMHRGGNWVGNYYVNRFGSARDVAAYVAANRTRLEGGTRTWRHEWYASTLPYWLLDRIGATVCNLATNTTQWWKNGRFWAWEGTGCCSGTCGHVWNYAHALARLFPDLERTVREMQDFAPGMGLDPETGAIGFRGENYNYFWAGDAQGGYILKAYREHLASPDDAFLKRNWKNIKKAMRFLIDQDGDGNGLLEGKQHQTYDQNYYGPNTMVGSLYLGALRSAEEMAREVGDDDFAATCRKIFEAGRENTLKRLFNGEYFFQEVDLEKHPDWQYGDGCLADQLFGQGWAHLVGLGYLYDPGAVKKALEAIWKYCWTPDIGPQNEAHKPERWFAHPGEAGLFTCTWPKSTHMGRKSTRYRNEIWTGIEYQVAGHMVWEGMITEALAMCRAVHDRYHPLKHNPFNEVECGDHYARALASWGVFQALCGYDYHGPHGYLAIKPKVSAERFRAPFTAAEGWGRFTQEVGETRAVSRIESMAGSVRLKKLGFYWPGRNTPDRLELTLDGKPVEMTAESNFDGKGLNIACTLAREVILGEGRVLEVKSTTA